MAFPRPISAVVFDMDGLLIDSEVMVRAAVMRAGARLGYDYDEALFARTIGCSDVQVEKVVAGHFGPDFPMRDFKAVEAAEIKDAMAGGVALKAGVVELMGDLDRMGLPFALATSSSREAALRHLTEHGLFARFKAVVAREDVARHKPDPAPYLEAARRLGIQPSACLALEDSHNGVRAAQGAGMMTVMVPDLLDPTPEMRDLCVHIVDDLHAVRRLLAATPTTEGSR